jgi:hypothetical protein
MTNREFRPGQRVRHTEWEEIVTIDVAGPTLATVTRPDGRQFGTSTHLLEPATARAPIPPTILAELADWMDERRENETSTGEIVESIDYKLRTLAGEDLTQTDPLPVGGEWPTLQRAMEQAEHNAGGGCDECPAPFDPYARVAELEHQLLVQAVTARGARLEIVRNIRATVNRMRGSATTWESRAFVNATAEVLDTIADKINDHSL